MLIASPLADLRTLHLMGTQDWPPPTPCTGADGFPHHPWAESSHTRLQAQTHTLSCFPGISSNSKCPRHNACTWRYFSRQASSQPSAPQRTAPPTPGLQPCNHPCSPSPHHHAPSTPFMRPAALPPNHILPTHQPLPGSSPYIPTQSPGIEHPPPGPISFPSSKSKTQPSCSSQLNVPFSKKPPCPKSQVSPEWSEFPSPQCPLGAHFQEPLSNALTSGVLVLFSLTI